MEGSLRSIDCRLDRSATTAPRNKTSDSKDASGQVISLPPKHAIIGGKQKADRDFENANVKDPTIPGGWPLRE